MRSPVSGSITVIWLDLVAEQLDADHVLLVRRVELDAVAADPEVAPHQVHVVAVVLHVDQPAQDVRAGRALRRPRTTSSCVSYSSGAPRP